MLDTRIRRRWLDARAAASPVGVVLMVGVVVVLVALVAAFVFGAASGKIDTIQRTVDLVPGI